MVFQPAEAVRGAGARAQRLSDRGRAEDARQAAAQPRHQTAPLPEADHPPAAEVDAILADDCKRLGRDVLCGVARRSRQHNTFQCCNF